MSSDWVLQDRVLGTLFFEDRHTGENLRDWILEMLIKFKMDPSKIVAVVHDNASNVVSTMEFLKECHGCESIRCSAHNLQLAVNSALSSSNNTQTILGRARKLVEHFRRSTVAKSALEKQQEQLQLKPLDLVQDVATR